MVKLKDGSYTECVVGGMPAVVTPASSFVTPPASIAAVATTKNGKGYECLKKTWREEVAKLLGEDHKWRECASYGDLCVAQG